MNFKELKENARNSLKGHYKDAIIMFIVLGLISSVAACVGMGLDAVFKTGGTTTTYEFMGQTVSTTSVGVFASIFSVISTALFMFGTISFFLKISRNEETTWKEIFSKVNMTGDYIVISFLVALFTTLWSILFIIPGIIAAFAYSQVYLVKLDDPEIGYMDAIKKSKELMKGHKMEFFLLSLSFIGWAILGIFTLGILYFWLVPYISVTEANFYNKLIEK